MHSQSDGIDFQQCGLYQFFSVDLIGSTARKTPFGEGPGLNDGVGKRRSWKLLIEKFFNEFPPEFCDKMAMAHEHFRNPVQATRNWVRPRASRPTFLKALGDELIYYVRVQEPESVRCYTLQFLKLLKSSNEKYTNRALGDLGELDGLMVKGTSWLCGVPVNNRRIELSKARFDPFANRTGQAGSIGESGEFDDFVGPSMDCGFRFAKYSDHRYVAIPPDLARVVLDKQFRKGLKFSYSGRESHKGVLGYRALPLVLLDNGFRLSEDKIGRGHPLKSPEVDHLLDTVKTELLEFKDRAWLIEPYFLREPQSYPHSFTNIPGWHKQELEQPSFPMEAMLNPDQVDASESKTASATQQSKEATTATAANSPSTNLRREGTSSPRTTAKSARLKRKRES